jgi:hypothetical protein
MRAMLYIYTRDASLLIYFYECHTNIRRNFRRYRTGVTKTRPTHVIGATRAIIIFGQISLFLAVTQRKLATFRDDVSVTSPKVKQSEKNGLFCPSVSVTNCQYTSRNISEERRSKRHRGGSLNLAIFRKFTRTRG